MFRFLKDSGTSEDLDTEAGDKSTKKNSTADANPLNAFVNHLIEERHYTIAREVPTLTYQNKSSVGDNWAVKYINVYELLHSKFVENDTVVSKISDSASDLISGIYEGGFKIWECTFDLIKSMQDDSKKYSFTDSKVLDLGCGSGLLGLFTLSRGASVHFHDYNPEVLNFLTIPNVITNHEDETVARCRFMSGDWAAFNRYVTESPAEIKSDFQYDYILSSETVYNIQYLSSLCSLIKTCLKPTGTMLLAAKTCYFGVGGGTKAFQDVIDRDGNLELNVLQVFRSGVQREIISVRWKN